MVETFKRVTIIGASGNVGKPVLAALLAAKVYEITVLSRKDSLSTFSSEVTVKKVDYDDLEALFETFKSQDVVVSTITTASIAVETKIVTAAIRAGVKRFIPSDFGNDITNDKLVELVPAFKNKRAVIDLLKANESKGISWTSIVTGPFFDWGHEIGLLGVDIKNKVFTQYDADAPAAWSTSNLSSVGASVVGVLQHPTETANRHVYVSFATLTGKELHSALERVSGANWSISNASTYELEKEGKDALARGDRRGIIKLIQVGIFRQGLGADFGLRKSDNQLLGLKEEDLDTVLEGLLA